jgi:glycosyltransferase involved in cell wall biosynthesis
LGAIISSWLRLPHLWHLREFGDLDYGLKPDWNWPLTRRIIGTADAHVAVSNAVLHHFHLGARKTAHVVYNGVASEEQIDGFADALGCDTAVRPFTFAIVGLLHPAKGQELAIRGFAMALERCPQARLLVAGDGDAAYMERCRNLVAELGVADRTRILGYQPDPFAVFLQADVALMCSANEAMGRTTAEAMATGRPVIGLRAGGTIELIEDGVTGLMFSGGEAELALQMVRLYRERATAAEMGRSASRKARAVFSVEAYSRRIHRILGSLVGSQSRAASNVPLL